MAINYQGGDDVVLASAFQPMMRTMQMNYENQLRQQQEEAKQRDAMRKQASGDLAKVNAGGLWKPDLPRFNEDYNAVKEAYYKMNTARDPNEQRQWSMEFTTRLNQLNNFVEQSRKTGENFVKAERDILSNSNKINLEQARASLNSFLEKPSYEIESGAFTNAISGALKKYDFDKEMSAYRQLGTSFAKNDANFTPSVTDTPEQLGGNRFVSRVTSYIPNPDTVLETVSNFFKSKPERQQMLQDYMEANGIADVNEAIASFAEQNNVFTKPSRTERINANERRTPTYNISVNMPSQEVASNYYPITVGEYTSQQTKTYSEVVPLIGKREVWTTDGRKYIADFKDVKFNGQALMTLPVDKSGQPLKTNSQGEALEPSKVAGYREFVAGTMPEEGIAQVYNALGTVAQSLTRQTALIPMSQIQWINQSKGKRADLGGIQRQAESRNVERRTIDKFRNSLD